MYLLCRRSLLPILLIMAFLPGTVRADQAAAPDAATAQPPRAVTVADADQWKAIASTTLSHDGKWLAYVLRPGKGDAELVVRRLGEEKEKRFPIGESGGGRPEFSHDSRWLAFLIAPPRRQAKETPQTRRPPSTKVAILSLETEQLVEIDKVTAFAFSGEQSNWIALRMAPATSAAATPTPPATPASSTQPDAARSAGTDLLLHELASGRQINVGNVSEFVFNKSGHWLAVVIDAANQAGNGVYLYQLAQGVLRPIENGQAKYSKLAWNRDGDALAVLKGVEDKGYEEPLYTLIGWKDLEADAPRKITFDPQQRQDFPEGMTISPHRSPQWDAPRTMLLFGIHAAKKKANTPDAGTKASEASPKPENPAPPPQDSQSETDKREQPQPEEPKPEEPKPEEPKPEEPKPEQPKPAGRKPAADKGEESDEKPAELVIWHWQDKRLQSQQQKEESRDKTYSHLSAFVVDADRFVRLADDTLREVRITPKQRWALGVDDTPYALDASLDGRRFQDVYVVDPRTGERWLAVEKCQWLFGASPDGNRFLFFDQGQFHTYEIALRQRYAITKDMPVSFVDTESDVNQVDPPIRPVGWSSDSTRVLLSDNWDVWSVSATGGEATNLTVTGQRDSVRHAMPYRLDPEQEGVDLNEPVFVSLYGEWTKRGGIGVWRPGSGGVERLLWDDARFGSLMKARFAEVYLYTRETNGDFPDYYLADATLRGERITQANPQQPQFAWSSGARLVDYTSTFGDRLQGALFLPAGYQTGQQYPTIVYIYEKLSSGLHRYSPPRIGGFSPSLYTSQGYAVLMADIRYQVNDPGLSAVACVLPALDAAIQTGIVDARRVGLHGHSWGGYQTAFLITQTDRFAAAVAGAPLTNLISMYSSIYWNSGLANQPIFESSQGRFTGGYWENIEAYARNSPVYHAPRVNTPLLLLHNDKDGAVDWNQGIEYFNTLRRLRKPVVMLQYKGENHGLVNRENQRDFSLRMLEFFDHYLKDQPAPKWWEEGVMHLDLDKHLKERAKGTPPPAAKSRDE